MESGAKSGPPETSPFSLFARMPDGKTLSLEAKPGTTVGEVAAHALARSSCWRLGVEQVYIQCGGHHLETEFTLERAGVGSLSTLRITPNPAAIRYVPTLADVAAELAPLIVQAGPNRCLPAEKQAELEGVLGEALESVERPALSVSAVGNLMRLGAMQALHSLCRSPCHSVRDFGLVWWQRSASALIEQYLLALDAVPKRLDPTRACLSAVLDALVPMVACNEQQLGRSLAACGGAWAAEKLGQMLEDTLAKQLGQRYPPGKLVETQEVATQLYTCLAGQLACLLDALASNLDVAFAGLPDMAILRQPQQAIGCACDAAEMLTGLMDAFMQPFALPLGIGAVELRDEQGHRWAERQHSIFQPVHLSLANLCELLVAGLDRAMAGEPFVRAPEPGATSALPPLAQRVADEAAVWLTAILSSMHEAAAVSATHYGKHKSGNCCGTRSCRWQHWTRTGVMLSTAVSSRAPCSRRHTHGRQAMASATPVLELDKFCARSACSEYAAAQAQPDEEELEQMDFDAVTSIRVSRGGNELVESSYAELLPLRPWQLTRELMVRFRGEPGHGAGVVREWLSLLLPQLLSPALGLFRQCGGNPLAIFPSTTASVQPQHLEYLRVAGRAMGLALLHGVPLRCHLAAAFHATLGGSVCRSIEEMLQQLQEVDPQMARSLQSVLEVEDASVLELTFTLPCEFLGQALDVPLSEAPSEPVTNQNRERYVQAAAEYLLGNHVKAEVEAVRQGLEDVLKQDVARLFSCQALNSVIEGDKGITPIQQWRQHTWCSGWGGWQGCPQQPEEAEEEGGPEEPEVLVWFWTLLGLLREEQRRALLRFWTSLPCLPLGGFAALPQQLRILRADPQTQPLPVARTCFYELLLPEYPDVLSLAVGLKEAIAHAEGFGFA